MRSIARQLHCDMQGAADEDLSGSASFVTVVQAADFPECDHVTLGDPCTRRGVGASFANERCVRDP